MSNLAARQPDDQPPLVAKPTHQFWKSAACPVIDQDVRDGRSDERDVFTLFANRDVWDGKTAWHQDNSGGVHPHDGAYSKRRSADDVWAPNPPS